MSNHSTQQHEEDILAICSVQTSILSKVLKTTRHYLHKKDLFFGLLFLNSR